jgi:hypothetical protein
MKLSISTYANNELRFVVSSDSTTRSKTSDNPLSGFFNGLAGDSPLAGGSPSPEGGASLLDIIKKSQSMESSSGKSKVVKLGHQWGNSQTRKEFSKNSRHLILESGAALERAIHKSKARFLTLTLPTSVTENYHYLADWSGYLINLLLQQIRNYRRDHKVKYEIYSLFVWEYQKRGALHLHFLLASEFQVDDLAQILYHAWFRGLEHIENKAGCDLFGQWRDRPDIWKLGNKIELIKKSIARYLSKYASKSATTISKFHITAYPSRFWGSSRNLKSLSASWRVKATFKNLDNSRLEYLCALFDDFLKNSSMNYQYNYTKGNFFVDGFVFYFPDDHWIGGFHEQIYKLIDELNLEALGIAANREAFFNSNLFDLLRSPVRKNCHRINICGDYSEQYKVRHGIIPLNVMKSPLRTG